MSNELSFGAWLRRRRQGLDMTREELASHIGYSAATLRKLEADELRPSKQLAEKLADHLDIKTEERVTFIRFARDQLGEVEVRLTTQTAKPLPSATSTHRLTNLPTPPTPLIGRAQEVARVAEYLRCDDIRLVTLTGPGGVGKTRLGLQVASNLLDEFEAGVFFVNLAPLTDPAQVVATISHTFGVREKEGMSLLESLKTYMRDKQLLLLLDNFEQLISAAPDVAELLAAAPQLKVLVTSREVLHLRGAQDIPIFPLPVPDLQPLPPIEHLSNYGSVELFIQRALNVKPDFRVTNENARAVAEICSRLDGLPLAIELAAVRIKTFPPKTLLDRLSNRLQTLTSGMRDLPTRQQTLRNTIDWSYNLLSADEKTLMRRVAVYAGGWPLAAVEAMCNADGTLDIDILDGMESLVLKSLVEQRESIAGEPRFTMLETIREYAIDRLAECGETETVRRQHMEYFLQFAREISVLRGGAEEFVRMARLDLEHDNLRQALSWAIDHNLAEVALQLIGALSYFWGVRGHLREGRQWLAKALSLATVVSVARHVRAEALGEVAALAFYQSDYEATTALTEESLALYQEEGVKIGIANSFDRLGLVSWAQLDFDAAWRYFHKALSLFRELGHDNGTMNALCNLSLVRICKGDYAGAQFFLEEVWPLFQSSTSLRIRSVALYFLGVALLLQGDYDRAQSLLKDALVLIRQMGDKVFGTFVLNACAGAAAGLGQRDRGVRLLGASDSLCKAIDLIINPAQRVVTDAIAGRVQVGMDEADFAEAWAEGRRMTFEEAVAYALETTPPSS